MSRNSEKAQSLLNRFQAQQYPNKPTTRPKTTKYVKSLQDAERFRSMTLQSISAKLTKINDMMINEYQIRDLNDELNNLMKEKTRWEYKIKELGGPDYLQFTKRSGGAGTTDNGELVIKGYRYFGRAKELPDVKQLVELAKSERKRAGERKHKSRNERAEFIKVNQLKFSSEYYGSTGDDKESTQVVRPLEQYENRKSRNLQKGIQETSKTPLFEFDLKEVVDSKAIENIIVEKKKQQLLAALDI
ncbi:unnamed protein product [Ambrosiozyma monospora]|uniref:Unnamed protein product n=1 Tax=Ambrosiozyma monospora TaxID=43982 RepID=A0ACB5T9C8_AMBMO|nr:unnamed protein product [Ambrosiozyma monospora]